MDTAEKSLSFTKKIWITGLILAFLIVAFMFFTATVHVFILILVGVLIACYFRGIATFITEKTNIPTWGALLISIFGTIVFFAGIFYLIGATISQQISQLKESFPIMLDDAERLLNQSAVGSEIVNRIQALGQSDKFEAFISGMFRTTFGGIGDLFVVILLGIYFTSSPGLYRRSLIQLIPPRKRDEGLLLMDNVASGLTKWLLGTFLSMFIIFVLTAIALAIVGLPMWLALAFLAGLLVFIPNFGPIIASIPTILVAFSISANTALVVAILFFSIQILEGAVITPKVQHWLMNIPPALIILAQIFAGILLGAWGLIFATPIMVVGMIVVQQLYIEPMNRKAGELPSAH